MPDLVAFGSHDMAKSSQSAKCGHSQERVRRYALQPRGRAGTGMEFLKITHAGLSLNSACGLTLATEKDCPLSL